MSELIARENQSLTPDTRVTLFEIDAREFGDGVLRFAPGPADGKPIRFNGYEYTPVPIEADGFKITGQGALPRPTLRVSRMSLAFLSLVISADGLVGAPVKRIRTFERFLDDGEAPDPEARYPDDHYVIEAKTKQNRVLIEFELSVSLDQQGTMIPARQVLRDTCTHTYRYWDGSKYRYDGVSCPYAGNREYDASGQEIMNVNQGKDVCGKRLDDCSLRFGKHSPLPFYGFPGVGRF